MIGGRAEVARTEEIMRALLEASERLERAGDLAGAAAAAEVFASSLRHVAAMAEEHHDGAAEAEHWLAVVRRALRGSEENLARLRGLAGGAEGA